MEIYISINGVLRNLIQKFDYHYKNEYLDSNIESVDTFNYEIKYPIYNDSFFDYYKFQSQEELEFFLFMEYPIEIFGHAGLSYSTTFSDLHKLIHENKSHTFTLIGLDELGKAKPATLFFLSKNGYLGDNIKFIRSENINDAWDKCDLWITDSEYILNKCPNNKIGIKFKTEYNQYFNYNNEITKLDKQWLNYLEKSTTLMLTQ